MPALRAHDPLSRPQSLTRGNGTATGFGFDLASRLQTLSHDLAGTVRDQTLTLDYTNASQLKMRTDSNRSYEEVAVPVGQSYVPNELNRYTDVSGRPMGPNLDIRRTLKMTIGRV